MDIASGIIVYILLWWWVFLMSLPFGVKREENVGQGHDSGAPKRPLLFRKVVATFFISAVLWLGVEWAINQEFLSFREMAKTL
ncbi:MAG: hypothetical protein CMM58_08135 [Rhodospirillaceae bacterium]|nr:hypothetical protein [Rhodospirillaceae bacterium]|tara:strand:- start:2240 stop:2488 length:249 start_codon:yes stop_codon:yes gene_type:complete